MLEGEESPAFSSRTAKLLAVHPAIQFAGEEFDLQRHYASSAGRKHFAIDVHLVGNDNAGASRHRLGDDDAEILLSAWENEQIGVGQGRHAFCTMQHPHEQHALGDTQPMCQIPHLGSISVGIGAGNDEHRPLVTHRCKRRQQVVESLLVMNAAEKQYKWPSHQHREARPEGIRRRKNLEFFKR